MYTSYCGRARRAAMRHYKARGWGGARQRRPLAHGELRYAVLKLIENDPKHGYELIKEIETRTGGVYAPSAGVMYPTLEMLVDLGWISSKKKDGKKVFSLTEDGEAALQEHAEAIEAVMAKLDALGEWSEDGTPVDLRDAMRRLNRTVLRRALSGELTRDQRDEIIKLVAGIEAEIRAL